MMNEENKKKKDRKVGRQEAIQNYNLLLIY